MNHGNDEIIWHTLRRIFLKKCKLFDKEFRYIDSLFNVRDSCKIILLNIHEIF